jgi:hypothetical protein
VLLSETQCQGSFLRLIDGGGEGREGKGMRERKECLSGCAMVLHATREAGKGVICLPAGFSPPWRPLVLPWAMLNLVGHEALLLCCMNKSSYALAPSSLSSDSRLEVHRWQRLQVFGPSDPYVVCALEGRLW